MIQRQKKAVMTKDNSYATGCLTKGKGKGGHGSSMSRVTGAYLLTMNFGNLDFGPVGRIVF